MNQLLSKAVEADPHLSHPGDKFVFVSDSTLPAKPFSQIYATLTTRQGSDFCVFPTKEWADIGQPGYLQILPKHHQWIILNRGHAEKALNLWASGHGHNIMQKYGMNHH